jgi:hypothetical protein
MQIPNDRLDLLEQLGGEIERELTEVGRTEGTQAGVPSNSLSTQHC